MKCEGLNKEQQRVGAVMAMLGDKRPGGGGASRRSIHGG